MMGKKSYEQLNTLRGSFTKQNTKLIKRIELTQC